ACRHGPRQAAVAAAPVGAPSTTPASSARARPTGSTRRAPGAAPAATRRSWSGLAGWLVVSPRPAAGAGAAPPGGAALEVGPAQLVFDLLVALLHPVAQPIQTHEFGQVGRWERWTRLSAAGAGEVGNQIPGGQPRHPGRGGGRPHPPGAPIRPPARRGQPRVSRPPGLG